eukprot:gene3567-13643_t
MISSVLTIRTGGISIFGSAKPEARSMRGRFAAARRAVTASTLSGKATPARLIDTAATTTHRVLQYAHSFRLNESLAASLASSSIALSLPLMALAGLLASATSFIREEASSAAIVSVLSTSVFINHLYLLAGFCLLAAAGLGGVLAYFQQKYTEDVKKERRVDVPEGARCD